MFENVKMANNETFGEQKKLSIYYRVMGNWKSTFIGLLNKTSIFLISLIRSKKKWVNSYSIMPFLDIVKTQIFKN